jgi:hypothetical protein
MIPRIIRPHIPRLLLLVLAASVCLTPLVPPSAAAPLRASAEEAKPGAGTGEPSSLPFESTFEPYYSTVRERWAKEQITAAKEAIAIPGGRIFRQSDDARASAGTFEGSPDALRWESEKGWIEYKVEIAEPALYEMQLRYFPIRGARAPIMLGVEIDGEAPFREARTVTFERRFKDEYPLKQDESGNEIRPKVQEIEGWLDKPFMDSKGAYATPLLWYFPAGTHTIKLQIEQQQLIIGSLKLTPPTVLQPYADTPKGGPQKTDTGAEPIVIEAEQMSHKNDTAIQMVWDKDPLMSPASQERITFNAVGGWRWFKGGQSVTWEFEVPESGRYVFASRVYQNFISNHSVFRTISIDGKIPFEELAAYRFPAAISWQSQVLGDAKGNPYEIYLDKGKHTITMQATYAPYAVIINDIETVSLQLRDVTQQLRALTGGQEDRNRVWRIDEEFPELRGRLGDFRDSLKRIAQAKLEANGRRDNLVSAIESAAKDMDTLLAKPNEIPYKIGRLGTIQEQLERIRADLEKMPLQLDKWYVIPAGGDVPRMKANFLEKSLSTIRGFIHSFNNKDDLSSRTDEALNVWVLRGRDYATELQQLADEQFVPEHGFKVKVNIIQRADQLIMARAAGIEPDVVLGVHGDMPFDMALRNSVLDLRQFPDSVQLMRQYAPGSLLPFEYDGGLYALPETMAFKVLPQRHSP